MPTDTFIKLSQEKKDKIIMAAKKEFSRVPIEDTSIKNIVEEAGIARGSFYQYFTSKEDLLEYMMQSEMNDLENVVKKSLEMTKGDIFEVFIAVYDYMVNDLFNQVDFDFHKRIFENMKTSEDTFFLCKEKMREYEGPFQKGKLFKAVDQTKLKIENEEDIKIILRMLYIITRKALVSNFKYESKEQARKEYIRQIEYLKYGICKN